MFKSLIRILIVLMIIAAVAWPLLPEPRKKVFRDVLSGEVSWRQLVLVNPFNQQTITRAEPLVAGLTEQIAQTELGRELLATMHLPQQYKCEAIATRDVKDTQASKLYRWQDAKGRWHFGDSDRGANGNVQDVSDKYQSKHQYFKLNLRGDHAKLPGFGQDKITAETKQIFSVLSHALSIDYLRQVDLNIRLLATQNDFQYHLQKVAPSLKTNSGFYSTINNEAVVWLAPNMEFTYGVIRHEASHVVMAGLYGYPPVWLNEGMAEYFERLNVSSNAKVISPNAVWLELLKKGGAKPLSEYFAIDPFQWRKLEQKSMYSMAWGLVYFFMSDDQHKQFLAQMLTTIAKNKCQDFSTLEYINQYYPQGLSRLEKNWQQWLLRTPDRHYY